MGFASRLVAVLPARLTSDLVDLLPVCDERATQTISTVSTRSGVFDALAGEEFCRSPAIGGSERLVVREHEVSRVKYSVLDKCYQYSACNGSGECSLS